MKRESNSTAAIANLAGAILETEAFQRLGRCTFLGILSPKFGALPGHPFPSDSPSPSDGNRLDHSIGVARLSLAIASEIGLSENARRHAAAWALLHDIATWPMSHTGEAAFIQVFPQTPAALRQQMIAGAPQIPAALSLAPALRSMGIDTEALLALFHKSPQKLDGDLEILWQLIHSPLTPDTLEGISRAANAYGIEMPPPAAYTAAFQRSFFGIEVKRDHSKLVFDFWKSKARVYQERINHPAAIAYESRWAAALIDLYQDLDFPGSMALAESEIIEAVLERGLEPCTKTIRYKAPLRYKIAGGKRKLPNDTYLREMGQYFIKAQ